MKNEDNPNLRYGQIQMMKISPTIFYQRTCNLHTSNYCFVYDYMTLDAKYKILSPWKDYTKIHNLNI